MILKKFCAAFMSVIMSVNLFVGVPQFAPANDLNLGVVSGVTEKVPVSSQKAQPFTVTKADGTMRRPLSAEQPMWIVHIDSWNYADPAKIIDLIPEDILPYVVFNISLSINWSKEKKEWLMVQYGYETIWKTRFMQSFSKNIRTLSASTTASNSGDSQAKISR